MNEAKATRLEDLKPGASVQGLTPSGAAKIVNVEWFGDSAICLARNLDRFAGTYSLCPPHRTTGKRRVFNFSWPFLMAVGSKAASAMVSITQIPKT